MVGQAHTTTYEQTGFFSRIVIDYLNGNTALQPFYQHPPNLEGIAKAIEHKKFSPSSRSILMAVLQKQYTVVDKCEAVLTNIELLGQENTYSVCTAHQPNLFTGPLYFIYKILHAIKLAQFLKEKFPERNFVPIYFMGSEDADLEELNHFTVSGKKYVWDTDQSGAVGRMVVDKKLIQLIDGLQGQLVDQFGPQFITFLKKCYTPGRTIQEATFELVHLLFSRFGLIVFIPDEADIKRPCIELFKEELIHQTSSAIVANTIKDLSKHYKVQAHPRDINLFYLKENIRERIIKKEEGFFIKNTQLHFTEEEMLAELENHPERFSPNVILRGLFQEIVLPNIAFIGGGGELAYWLQLKDLFDYFKTPFPVLILRNSFLMVAKKWTEKMHRLGMQPAELFLPKMELLNKLVIQQSGEKISLEESILQLKALYQRIQQQAVSITPTMSKHVLALQTQTIGKVEALEKKMLRAEKRKFKEEENKLEQIKNALFPNNNLQERIENISGFYEQYGPAFIDAVYEASFPIVQKFVVMIEE
ncbi:MAG: bacillithiol biosynthesis cysteine-adding enzyme BshC [Chitinophagaceae bacterium]